MAKTLAQALKDAGFGYRFDLNADRNEVFRLEDGQVVGRFDSREAWELVRLSKALESAQKKSTAASDVRFALTGGSSRARVTSANAKWMRAAEARDRALAHLNAFLSEAR